MQDIVTIGKALSDSARVRALLALGQGELCLCQIIELLALAPSTVSKHMDVLYQAGLVERRKEGRWHYFRRPAPGKGALPVVRGALRWLDAAGADTPMVLEDRKTLCCVRRRSRSELAACYRG